MLRILALLVLVASALATGAGGASAAQQEGGRLDLFWDMPGAQGDIWNIDQLIQVAQKANHSYWSLTWYYVGPTFPDNVGYMGLQTDALRPDGTTGEMAIFSLWAANASRGGACAPFGGEGVGLSCKLNFPFAAGAWYRLRVWKLEGDAGGQWWGGWVSDGTTDYHIGDIRVPAAGHQFIESVANFSEYFGDAVACDQVPRSIAEFTHPVANSQGDGAYQYYASTANPVLGRCATGRATATDYGWTQGYRVVLGDGAPAAACASGFADVPSADPACPAIAALASRGVIGGYQTTPATFGPGDAVQRAQMAAFLVRAFSWQGRPQGPRAFSDLGPLEGTDLAKAVRIAANACDAQGRCVAAGYGDGRFGPTDQVTRAQVISLVARAFGQEASYAWQAQPNGPQPYGGVPAVHETDIRTYTAYAGTIPDAPTTAAGWNAPAPRAWVARVLYQALQTKP